MAEIFGGGAERKVMVAIDESDYSHYALMWVLENLKESITKSPLVIFMAQPPTKSCYTFAASLGSARMYCPVSATPEFVNSVKENNKKLTSAFLEKAKEICASHGVNAETLTEVGDPSTAICNAVQKFNINLLVLGERGLGKLKRALLGSVSSYCVQNAKCPVLVVKKP
ncbi:Universal stress protein A-like protein [Morella rubra]|uniref:Universal stress protein A-like protein n=1 Tax=Morella rubra TaxID=262757 RepID=A0A6A1W729_9ROSI|nr:Universal stress protein A-like protein [Morella rubra]